MLKIMSSEYDTSVHHCYQILDMLLGREGDMHLFYTNL